MSLCRRPASATPCWALAAGALLAASNASAADAAADTATVDRYIATEMREQKIPGLSLAVRQHERLAYVKGYGVATLEHPVPATPATLYQIGSIGKQFTATAVMLLVREGKIALDDLLSKYLPEIPPPWHAVTLRLMLNHQSGIAQLTPPARDLLDLHHDYSDEEYIRLATSVPLDFEPGTDASYSDTAYVLLGFVVNRVAGRFYGDLLAERVFRPLGMTNTRIVSDADIIVGRAAGYEMSPDGTLRNQAWVAPALNRTADGSLYSTVLDLARWDAALTAHEILSASELERTWTIDPLRDKRRPFYNYGYGWESNSWRGHRVIEYDGNWQGFQGAMARYADRQLTVIVLTNLSLCRTQRIAHTVAALFDPTLGRFDTAPPDRRLPLTREFEAFLAAAEHGTTTALPLTAAGRQLLSATWIGALGRDLRTTGPVETIALAGETISHGTLERVYRVETKEMVDYFTVRYGEGGAVDDVSVYREY